MHPFTYLTPSKREILPEGSILEFVRFSRGTIELVDPEVPTAGVVNDRTFTNSLRSPNLGSLREQVEWFYRVRVSSVTL